MYNPPTLADGESVRLRHGEIVHGLHPLDNFNRLDRTVAAIQREDVIPY